MSVSGEGDAELAARLAEETGRLLLDRRPDLFASHTDSRAIKDAADALAQEHLSTALRASRPQDAVLSEEAPDDLVRLTADRVWIIDPLDGTREYARAGRVDWAVHVALWERGKGLTAGAVALPAQDLVLATHTVPASKPRLDARGTVKVVVSGSRTPALLETLGRALPLAVSTWGSAGAKAARVITGVDDLYLHDSALNEWDAAAPVAVALAAGLMAVDIEGRPFTFNRAHTAVHGLVMGRPLEVERVLAVLASPD
jgi:3'(2'), 5'-bisphosphate nucleotidase